MSEEKDIIKYAKEKGLIKTYSEFLETKEAEIYALSEEEANYYITKHNDKFKRYNIGDIVFVTNYQYKSGKKGENHSFVIVQDNGNAIDIDYFGFLLSSQFEKASYSYNEKLYKNETNNLYKNSIVKCDDLIAIAEHNIKFKIGEVTNEELEKIS